MKVGDRVKDFLTGNKGTVKDLWAEQEFLISFDNGTILWVCKSRLKKLKKTNPSTIMNAAMLKGNNTMAIQIGDRVKNVETGNKGTVKDRWNDALYNREPEFLVAFDNGSNVWLKKSWLKKLLPKQELKRTAPVKPSRECESLSAAQQQLVIRKMLGDFNVAFENTGDGQLVIYTGIWLHDDGKYYFQEP